MTRSSRATLIAALALLLLPAAAHATPTSPAFIGETSGDTQVTVGHTVHAQATVTNVGTAAEPSDLRITITATNGATFLGASRSDGGTASFTRTRRVGPADETGNTNDSSTRGRVDCRQCNVVALVD